MAAYTKSIDTLHKVIDEADLTWDEVIGMAEAKIREHNERIVRLERTIKIAREMIAEGVPLASAKD